MSGQASDAAQRAFHQICEVLGGLSEEDARDATMNAMARVLMVQAPNIWHALRQAGAWHGDIRHCIKTNWPNIERERAGNGGRQPEVTSH